MSPAFANSYLNGLEPLFQNCVQALVRVLNTKCIDSKDFVIINIDRMLSNLGAVSSLSIFPLTLA